MTTPRLPQTCGKDAADLFDVAGLASWLRTRFPRSTGYHVEASTGISAASVENWLQRRSSPSVQHFSILLAVFGPSLVHACLRKPAAWINDAVTSEKARHIDAAIARLELEKQQIQAAS